ncbi:unnamed protein product [Urochloa decumbens]|uniref:DUF1618 domain-containing protein n=1 Tax=Urochloa decumbens TaxID=240449 RepID=A0ABC9EK70_9POAL
MAPASSANLEGAGVNAPNTVLLDIRAYSAPRRNAFTATSKTSTGHPIEVTFIAGQPPVLSHLSVHCPGLQLPSTDLSLAPKSIAVDADLILFRVPINRNGMYFYRHNDYFVYRAHHQHPKLYLLPKSSLASFGDEELVVLSCGAAATDGDRQVCPISNTAPRLLYHLTTKVIVIGGTKGTIGWVDLWRGILFCDVLEENPKLRDMPLPLPAKGNWRNFLNGYECCYRDITVNHCKDSIKYVEMEIIRPRNVTTAPSGPEPLSYLEWLHSRECPSQSTCTIIPGHWKATTWSMPIPVASWDDWHRDCTTELHELGVDNPRHRKLLHKLMSSSGNNENTTEATCSLGCLHMAYPTLSIDDDVVYLLVKATSGTKMGVIAVDLRLKKLQGVAKLDSKRNTSFIRRYLACEISKHLKTKGTRESLGQTVEHMPNPSK